jgi:class 3 adenylate cyclase/pimeloyl-ACP methyl ester carboxylesterase
LAEVGPPQTSYAWNGDVCLAYQVLGDGPIDLLYLQGYCSHVDMNWQSPRLARFLRGLAGHGRVMVTDRRGWGCSDRFASTDIPDVDSLTDDLLTVLDAAGSTRSVVVASGESALVAMLFAAAYPERVSGLALIDAYATYARTDETPWAPSERDWREAADEIRQLWGTPDWLVPNDDRHALRWDDTEAEWFVRYMRSSITPAGLAAEMLRFVGTDLRAVLPSIQVPTLVFVGPRGYFENPPEASRFLAARIPGARSVELASDPGVDMGLHWYTRAEPMLAEIGRFVDGLRETEASFDRVLATILFTDIVDSTAQAAALGDRRWREVREEHDRVVRTHLARFRGKEIKTMGDGFLATFDGPARAVRCAIALREAVGRLGIEIRTGLHTGEVERDGDDVAGIGVAIGARVGARAGPSEVLVSQTVKDLVMGSGLTFEDAGEHELKGVPDRWHLYRVVG